MARNDIGGFFVSLGLNIDRNSFETGNRLIDGVGNSFNKLIGSARNAAVVLAGTAIATGAVESAASKTAAALGISTEALDLWKATAKIAGVNADGLVSSISKIAGVQNRIKFSGSGLSELQTQLNKLQMSYAEIQNLSADKATQRILEKAQSMLNGQNTAEIAAYVEDILGGGARDFFVEIVNQNKTVAEALSAAQKTIFTTSEDNKKGAGFNTEANMLKAEMQSLSKLFGDSVAGALTDSLSELNKFIQTHGEDIAEWIRTAGDNVAKLVEFIVGEGAAAMPTIKKTGEVLLDSVEGTLEGTKNIVEGVKEGDGKKVAAGAKKAITSTIAPAIEGSNAIEKKLTGNDRFKDKTSVINEAQKLWNDKYGDHPILNYLKKLTMEELPDDLQQSINKIRETDPKWLPNTVKLKDGIIRPDGTIAQVSPDDWVFAARNLGDLARAFIPQNYNSVSGGEYIINQTFNINGGNDMPQLIRQQAYKGTQDGLLEMMQKSSQRLQLMSGIR